MDYIKYIKNIMDFIVSIILNITAYVLLVWRIFSHTEVPVRDKELQLLLICIIICFSIYLIYAFLTRSVLFNILLILLPTHLWFEGFKTSVFNKGNTYIDLIDKVAFPMIGLCLVVLVIKEIIKIIKVIKSKRNVKN